LLRIDFRGDRRDECLAIDQLHGAPAMEQYIRRQNVAHFRHLLATVSDERERQRILKLLEEERRKQREAGDKTDPD